MTGAKALEQLGVNRLAHAAIVGVVKDVLPEAEAGLLARLGTDITWKDGPSSTMVGRLVDAALRFLTTPPTASAVPAYRQPAAPVRDDIRRRFLSGSAFRFQ
ncbi:hypothetical protein [Streptomyces xanthophaeus]